MTDEKRDDIRPSVTELSHKQTTNRMKDLGEEIRRVAEKDELSDKDDEYLRELKSEFETLERHARKLERQALVEKIDYATGNPLTAVRGDNPRSSNEADRHHGRPPDRRTSWILESVGSLRDAHVQPFQG